MGKSVVNGLEATKVLKESKNLLHSIFSLQFIIVSEKMFDIRYDFFSCKHCLSRVCSNFERAANFRAKRSML